MPCPVADTLFISLLIKFSAWFFVTCLKSCLLILKIWSPGWRLKKLMTSRFEPWSLNLKVYDLVTLWPEIQGRNDAQNGLVQGYTSIKLSKVFEIGFMIDRSGPVTVPVFLKLGENELKYSSMETVCDGGNFTRGKPTRGQMINKPPYWCHLYLNKLKMYF